MVSKLFAILICSLVGVTTAFAQTKKYELPNGHFNFKLALADMEGKDNDKYGAAVTSLVEHGAAAIPDIFAFLAQGKYPEFRMGLANIALGYEAEAKPHLIKALESNNKFVRLIAAKVISLGADENIEPVFGHNDGKFIKGSSRKWLQESDIRAAMIKACKDDDIKVRVKVIDYCALVRATEGVQPAMQIIADKRADRVIRWQVVEALAKFDQGNVSEILRSVKDIMNDRFTVLANIGTNTAYQIQTELLKKEYYPSKKEYELAMVMVPMEIIEFHRKESLSLGRELVNSEEPSLLSWAGRIIGDSGGQDAIPELLELSKSTDLLTRGGAIQGLGYTKSPKAFAPLCAFVEKLDDDSMDAIFGLTELGDMRAIKFLERFTKVKDKYIRAAAVDAIKNLKLTKSN